MLWKLGAISSSFSLSTLPSVLKEASAVNGADFTALHLHSLHEFNVHMSPSPFIDSCLQISTSMAHPTLLESV